MFIRMFRLWFMLETLESKLKMVLVGWIRTRLVGQQYLGTGDRGEV